jgi:hypothetical protein
MAQPVKQKSSVKREPTKTAKWWMDIRWASLFIAGLAFILYSNSLTNGFVLDDSLVITKNSYTTKGISGIGDIFSHDTFQGYYGESSEEIKITGGRYRPLSIAFFAILYSIFRDNPFPFHLWNVLLYAVCCAFVYRVLRRIFDPSLGVNTSAIFSGLTALLFTLHPVHTEVVNNIKSNDEILCLLLSFASLYLAVRYWDTNRKSLAYMSGIALFLACLAKENAVVFLAIIPLTLFVRGAVSKVKGRPVLPLVLSLGISFSLFFIIRYSILGWSMGEDTLDLINNPFIKYTGDTWVHCSFGEKMAMIFWSLARYIQLLFFPLFLSVDYYPRFVEVMTFSNPLALVSLLAHVALGLWVVYKLWKKQTGIVEYGVAFYLIALSIVSNILFPVGTNLAERFLFTPSLGFCIAIAGLVTPYLAHQHQTISKLALYFIVGVMVVFGIRTHVRNFDFESNKVLMMKDVEVAGNSAKIQNALGAIIAEEALNSPDPAQKSTLSQNALNYLNKAISIHPTYLEAFYMRGNVLFMLGRYEEAIQNYRACLSLNPNFSQAYPNYAMSLREYGRSVITNGGDLNNAVLSLEESLELYPNEEETRNLLDQAKKMQASR